MTSKKHIILSGFTIFGLILLLLLTIFGEKGYMDLKKMKAEKQIWIQENEKLKQENAHLNRLIQRLESDPEFIENVARQDLGMIGKDEVMITMKSEKKKNTNPKQLKGKNHGQP